LATVTADTPHQWFGFLGLIFWGVDLRVLTLGPEGPLMFSLKGFRLVHR
jgi:hypothetical protein